jgi:hypothetical protein
MINKKRLLILSFILCTLFAISSVSASDLNQTDVAFDNQPDDEIPLETHDDSSNGEVISAQNPVVVLNSTDDDSAVSREVSIESDSQLSTNYADAYIDSITTKYNSGEMLYLGWSGYFDGNFEVYEGDSMIYEEYLTGTDKDLQWDLEGLDVGTYNAKLITYNGITLATGKIVIQKSSSKISVKSFKATAGSKFYCYAYVKDKFTGRNYNGGTVKFKINGKTYRTNLIDGVAVAKIKIPSTVKKYTCSATFGGGSNVYKSSTKFTVTVKKKPTYKVITAKTKMSDTKYLSKYWGKYEIRTYKFKHSFTTVCIMLYKNGKMLNLDHFLSKIHYKENGKWKWSDWSRGSREAMYHKYYFSNDKTIGNVKVKFKVS